MPVLPENNAAARIVAALSLNPLYFILDESICKDHEPKALARSVLDAGVRMMQVRFKQLDGAALLELLQDLRKISSEYGCLLFVNDDPELANSCGADGVHVGPGDANPDMIRKKYPGLIIGCSARDANRSRQLQDSGADYIGCGAMFRSTTKSEAPVVGPARLAEIVEAVDIPVIGIGGITAANYQEVLDAGAAGVCCIAAFCSSNDPGLLAGKFRHTASGS